MRSTSAPAPGATTTMVVVSTTKLLPSTSVIDTGRGTIACAIAIRVGAGTETVAGAGVGVGVGRVVGTGRIPHAVSMLAAHDTVMSA